MNYQENLTQSDKQELMREVDATTELLLSNINEHLERQDRLLELLLERTKVYDGQ